MDCDHTPHVSTNAVFGNCNSEMKESELSFHFQPEYLAKVSECVLKELPIIDLRPYQTRNKVQSKKLVLSTELVHYTKLVCLKEYLRYQMKFFWCRMSTSLRNFAVCFCALQRKPVNVSVRS